MTLVSVSYKGRTAGFDDVEFLLLLFLVFEEVAADPSGYEPLADRLAALDKYFTDWSPGEVGPDLEHCLNDRSSEVSFLAALEEVEARLMAAGPTVPAALVEAFGRKQSYGWPLGDPFTSKRLVRMLEDLRLLVEGPEDPIWRQLDRYD